MKQSLYDWCMGNAREKLLNEWDYEKNFPLTPESVSSCSGKKVWWKCDKGHSWEALISNRNRGQGCPFCSGHQILTGFNDLASQYPELLSEWDYNKNTDIYPNQIAPKSDKKAWWICEKGHSWQAAIKHRVLGTGCPICANKVVLIGYNDLASTNPNLLLEWDFEKNEGITPEQCTFGSNKSVWWKCKNNHSWKAIIGDRVRGNSCPYCSKSKDIKSVIIKGHTIPHRVISGARILPGYNDLCTLYPELMQEWDFEENTAVDPTHIGRGSEVKTWWKCDKGHSWQAVVSNRIKGTGCPICSKGRHISMGEKAIYYYVKQQYPDALENYHDKWLGKSELDIFIPSIKCAIEYDGSRWHQKVERDAEKDMLCANNNIFLIRIREAKCPIYESTAIKYYLRDNSENELINAIRYIFSALSTHFGISSAPVVDLIKNREKVYEIIYQAEIDNSVQNLFPNLVEEWDFERNGSLTPDKVFAKSKAKVWWKCQAGHSWQSVIYSRTNGSGCPICSGKRVLIGFNDLLTKRPDIAAEWNYEKNSPSPSEVTEKSNKKVWWICIKGHEWESKINNRTSNNQGCPICYRLSRLHDI